MAHQRVAATSAGERVGATVAYSSDVRAVTPALDRPPTNSRRALHGVERPITVFEDLGDWLERKFATLPTN